MAGLQLGLFTSEGDTLIVVLDPIERATAINSITKVTTGEDVDNYLTILFRYSTDRYNWSAWLDPAIALPLVTDQYSGYEVQVQFTRHGTAQAAIFLKEVLCDATIINGLDLSLKTNIFKRDTIFNNINISDIDWHQLCANLYDKMYQAGIIPQYVNRTADYHDFWHNVTCYFALFYVFARQFSEIYTTQDLLVDYLEQEGLFLCGDEDVATLQTFANNIYDIVRKRGTFGVVDEYQRLICAEEYDEFIFALLRGSWLVQENSPTYRGLEFEALNKMFEKTDSIGSLNNFNLFNGNRVTLVSDIDNNGNAITVADIVGVSVGDGEAGVGWTLNSVGTPINLMPFSKNVDYEFSFMIKTVVNDTYIKFGVAYFDKNKNFIATSNAESVDMATGNDEWRFMDVNRNGNVYYDDYWTFNTNKYMLIRGILFSQNEALHSSPLNCGVNGNIKSIPGNAVYFYPIIFLNYYTSGTHARIYRIRVAPARTQFSRGFVGLPSLLISFYHNNNPRFADTTIEQRVKKYLLPLNNKGALISI